MLSVFSILTRSSVQNKYFTLTKSLSVLNRVVLFCILPVMLLKTVQVPKLEYDFIHIFKDVTP